MLAVQPHIRPLRKTARDITLGETLVREYTRATAEEVAEPGAEPEIDTVLPYIPDWSDFAGHYFRGGSFLAAIVDHEVAGGVGIVPANDHTCELNRLWVRPAFRRRGVARELVCGALREAERLGFARMTLHSLVTRQGVLDLYRGLGFEDATIPHRFHFEMVSLARNI